MRRALSITVLAGLLLGACSRDPARPPLARRQGPSSRAVMIVGDPSRPAPPPVASGPADRQAQCRTLRQRVLTEAVAFLAPLGRGLDQRAVSEAYELDHEPSACLTLQDEAIDCLLRAAHPLAPSRRCGVDDRLRLGVPRTIRQRLTPGPFTPRFAGLSGRWVREAASPARPERLLVGETGELTWETASDNDADATTLTGILRTDGEGETWLETPTRAVPLALLRIGSGTLLLSDNPLLAPWPAPADAPVLAPLGRDTVAVLGADRCAVIDLSYLMRLPATCVTTRSEGNGHPVITVTYHHVDTPFSAVFHLLEGHVVPEALLARKFTRLSAAAGASPGPR